MLKYEKELEHEANEEQEWLKTNKHSEQSRKVKTYETRVARRYSGNYASNDHATEKVGYGGRFFVQRDTLT